MGATEILTEALRLSDSERAEVAHQLLLSLEDADGDEHFDDAFLNELSRRREELRSGTVQALNWDDAMIRIRERIEESR